MTANNTQAVDSETASRLTAADLERHQRMLRYADQAQQLQPQIDQRAARQQELLAAVKVWCEELHERYALATDGSENIAPDGTITRRH